MGSQIGKGRGKKVATVAGVLVGGKIGMSIPEYTEERRFIVIFTQNGVSIGHRYLQDKTTNH